MSSGDRRSRRRGGPKPPPTTVYLIAGAGGMLGTALKRVLAARGTRFVAPPEAEFDICDFGVVTSQAKKFARGLGRGERGVIVNAAAYTDVERAEDEPDLALLVNERGAVNLARAAHESGVGFVHVSTDFVFDGLKEGPYLEDDEPHPLSVYGETKLAGEDSVAIENPDALIIRTAWVFGPGGVNFPTKILDAARANPVLRVVTDEIGSPTYTIDLANGLLALVDAKASGLVHLCNTGACSRFELAQAVLAEAGIDTPVEPVEAAELGARVARPANSVLDCSRAASLGVTLPPWRDAVARFVAERAEEPA